MLSVLKARLRSSAALYRRLRLLRNRYQAWRYGVKRAHPTAYLEPGCAISRDLIVHEFAFVAGGCRLGPNVEIGKYVMLAPRAAIVGADHVYDRPGIPMIFAGRPDVPKTLVGDDAWIGYGAVVMAGISIGRGAIIAAGAVVTKDVPPYEIWGGVPARKLGERFASADDRAAHDRMLAEPAHEGSYAQYRFG